MKRPSTRQLLPAVLISVLLMTTPGLARGDVEVQFLDDSRIIGTYQDYTRETLTLRLPSGARLQLPKKKIRRITFRLPAPRAALNTPPKTFARMFRAAINGDLATYVDCHSAFYQMFLKHQISMTTTTKFIKRLRREYTSARISVLKVAIKKDQATVKVRRIKDKKSQDGELRFVRENSEWKMVLPL